jgi:hypothetical protein
MSIKQRELEDGCFSRALDDEPMFVLLARDDQAPQRVRDWATQRRADISMGRRPASDQAVVDDAFETADRMEEWRRENDGKWRNGLFSGVDPRAADEARHGQ